MKQTLEELLRDMKSLPEVQPRMQFRANARVRILNVSSVRPASVSLLHRMNFPYHIARWAGGIALATSLLGGTLVYAAQYSNPGTPLYPIKTASEEVALRLAPTTGLKTSIATTVIDRRAAEVNDLEAHGSRQDVEKAVTTFQTTAHSLENIKGINIGEVESHVRDAERDWQASPNATPRGTDSGHSGEGKNQEREGRVPVTNSVTEPTPSTSSGEKLGTDKALNVPTAEDVKGVQINVPAQSGHGGETQNEQ